MKHLATTLIGALTFYGIAPGSLAAPTPELRTQVVKFADLDLTRAAGAQELYRRIEQAARQVCPAYGRGGYDRGCADRAIAHAVADIGAPLLTTRHERLAHHWTLLPQQARLER
jgi:UrcA family protein